MNATTLRSPLGALALATTLALVAAGGSANAAGITNGMPVAHATALRQGDVVTGVLSGIQPMHVVIALKLRNHEQLDSLVSAHRTLTAAQFATRHGPTQVQAQTVANYLKIMGFTNIVIAPNRLLVSADGVAANARAAFLTSFARVQTREGRQAFANTSDAVIPAALQDSVLSVIGLQSVHQVHSFAVKLQPNSGVGTFAAPAHVPTEFSSIYGATGVATAAGVTVGIMTIGDLSQTITDLNTFTDNHAFPRVTTQTVVTGPSSGDTSGILEWNLDSQSVVGMGGGAVGKIIFYNQADYSNPGLVASLNTAVTANAAKIIDASLGECELAARADGSAAAADQIFKMGVAQGQTFSISTGDSGADECRNGGTTPSWPSNSPYVVAVAGTTLDASTTTWNSETVWRGSGGSPSTYEPKPSWQTAMVPGSMRGVADVAFDADPNTGALITMYGGTTQVGGTSLAAPIFAGMWARVIGIKGSAIGFAAPLLYRLPTTDFHDVVLGNNGGETAKSGYDFATGRGSVILGRAIAHVGAPSPLVVNFTYTASGLVLRFTDRSTDSAGTLTSHTWAFGDGGKSVAVNPSHLFGKSGIYNVTEIVTDSAGYQTAATLKVKVGGTR